MSTTEKATRHAILMNALDLFSTTEDFSVEQWNALEELAPGPFARQLRSLTDAVFADQQRRGERFGRT